MKGRAALAAVVLCCGPTATRVRAQEPMAGGTLSFAQAMQRALEANRNVDSAREAVAVSRAEKRAALSYVLPQLAVSGSYTRNSDEIAFGTGDAARIVLPRNDWEYRVVLDQPIFAGFRDLRVYDQSKVALATAREGVRSSEDAALLVAGRAYLDVVQAEALIAVEEQNVALAERRHSQAQAFYEVGETTRVDVLRAEADIKAAQRRLVVARQARVAAAGELRVALALDGEFSVEEPEAGVIPPVPDLETLVARAREARPDLRQARQAVEIAGLQVKQEKGAYLPVVSAQAGYVKQKREFPVGEYGFASVRVSVPVFQGGRVGARVAAARGRERQAELAVEELDQRIREEVRTELAGLEAARTALALSEEQLTAATADYEQTFEQYRGQELTGLDVQVAEASVAEARRATVNSRLVLRLQEMRAWYAAGSLRAAIEKEVVQ